MNHKHLLPVVFQNLFLIYISSAWFKELLLYQISTTLSPGYSTLSYFCKITGLSLYKYFFGSKFWFIWFKPIWTWIMPTRKLAWILIYSANHKCLTCCCSNLSYSCYQTREILYHILTILQIWYLLIILQSYYLLNILQRYYVLTILQRYYLLTILVRYYVPYHPTKIFSYCHTIYHLHTTPHWYYFPNIMHRNDLF